MEKKERKHHTLRLWVRITMALIITSGIFLSLLGIYLGSVIKKPEENKKIYNSTINKNVAYKVYLFNNNFVDKNEMDSNQIYIADLVRNIKFNFMYTYSGTNRTNLNYAYSVTGKLYGENVNRETGSNETVWEKSYDLIKETKKDIKNSSGFNITQNLDINYPKYQEEVNNFKKRFGMSLTTKLQVTMNIKITGGYQGKTIDKTDKIVFNIPLGVQAFSITEDYQKQNSIALYDDSKTMKVTYSIYTKSCIVVMIISIILFILTFKLIFNIKPKSQYTKTLNKILKTYDQIIVEVESPVKEKGYHIVLVKNFDEMLDLEEELRIPIIFYENTYKYRAIFTITYNDTIYKYILRNKR